MTSREEIIRTLALLKITLRFPLYGLRRKVKTFLTIFRLEIEAKNRSFFETEESNCASFTMIFTFAISCLLVPSFMDYPCKSRNDKCPRIPFGIWVEKLDPKNCRNLSFFTNERSTCKKRHLDIFTFLIQVPPTLALLKVSA